MHEIDQAIISKLKKVKIMLSMIVTKCIDKTKVKPNTNPEKKVITNAMIENTITCNKSVSLNPLDNLIILKNFIFFPVEIIGKFRIKNM